ncbi:malto-oligosyltrehalose synthase [Reyranella sp. CPCC 100927]|nr:malto-oligosyltrehalose synthase [Reyranella sp. CPCC 100927]
MMRPRATVRLQFHRGFTLDDALGLVPYFADLGLSHIYASPLMTARSGSLHGYDIVDHTHINPELGGYDALQRLVTALRSRNTGLILDIVPNHMAVGGDDNTWWLDVLEWGPHSRYARFFDIDWKPRTPTLHGKVLAPFLGESYGTCLERGDIALRFDPTDGRFFAAYYHHRFPINLASYADLLGRHASFRHLADTFSDAFASRQTPDGDTATRLRHTLRQRDADAMAAVIEAHDASHADGRQRLHTLLERQYYQLSWWGSAADRINWRRFFDVNDLAALRIERQEVFDATHALILQLYADGLIDGVRVDHVDGLTDPGGYCRRLRRSLEARTAHRPAGAPSGSPYVIVEKILAPDERLRASWRTDGTSGYDFMNDVSAVQHAPDGENALTTLWQDVSGSTAAFDDVAHAAKPDVLATSFSGAFAAACDALDAMADHDFQWRDTPSGALRQALLRFLVHLPVYRLYGNNLDAPDRAVLAATLRKARLDLPVSQRRALILVARALTQQRLAARLQHLSAPLTAKAVEDTAFYRYGRLLSRNDVGASPAQFALSPDQFHASCRQRLQAFPAAMLATATHDHKRGEDLRARLAVLSEIPQAWAQAVQAWTAMNAPLRTRVGTEDAPDAADAFMLYQMMAGGWPLDLSADDQAGVLSFAERLAAWQQKALREAKRQTSWRAPNRPYEDACRQFVMRALGESTPFRHSLQGFVGRIAAAGALNGLVQALLRVTVPGVPDLYQGTELWDFSMVDPDNRRPVDFNVRQAMLARDATCAELLATWHDGAVKQRLIADMLRLRQRRPVVFAEGSYSPLSAKGPCAAHVLGFARQHGTDTVIVLATRLPLRLQPSLERPLIDAALWQDTHVDLPGSLRTTRWRNVLTGSSLHAETNRLRLNDVLAALPMAVLEPE